MENRITLRHEHDDVLAGMEALTLDAMKRASVWVNFYLLNRAPGQHSTKPPLNPKAVADASNHARYNDERLEIPSLLYASTGNPDTWSDYATAKFNADVRCFRIAGVGVVLQPGMVMIDTDADDNGHISDIAESIVRQFSRHTYTEVSPSGHGYHILCLIDAEKLPVDFDDSVSCRNDEHGLELYIGGKTNRYATFTGNSISTVLDLTDCTQAVLQVIDLYFRKSYKPKPLPFPVSPSTTADDHHERALSWREKVDFFLDGNMEADRRFADHWNGRGFYPDKETGKNNPSLNDFVFMCDLVYRLGRDEQDCINAFRASPYCTGKDFFHRKKADRDDYMKLTFKQASSAVTGTTYPDRFKYHRKDKNPHVLTEKEMPGMSEFMDKENSHE